MLTRLARFACAAHRVISARWAQISDRRLSKAKALRASEARFRRAFEIETVGVIFFNMRGRFTQANDAFLDMCGFTREDIEAGSMSWQNLTPPEWMERSHQAFAELKDVGRTKPYEKEYFRKDGSRWWALFAARRISENEAVEYVLDITAQKEAEARLRESERRFRTLAEGIPQLVWRSAPNGEGKWGSPQWISFTGLSEEASVGLGWLNAIHPDDLAATMAAWAAAKANGFFSVEHRIRHAEDGAYRWFQSRAVPVHDEHGHITEYLGTSTDIEDQVRAREVLTRSREELEALVAERTSDLRQALDALHAEALERLQAEEALRQSQKMEAIGQLTGGIAHDFSNLLQSVSGSLEMARRRLEEGRIAGAVRFLDAASGATDRAAGLTQRLLAFARRQRLEPRPVDPGELVAGMADLIRRTMGAPVTVELRLGNDGAWVWCDPNALESALLNLCINARDAMPEGGRLTIATENVRVAAKEAAGQEGAAPGDYVAITASDTGEGMAPDVLERAFEPFFTTKPQGQGTGLGLSQVFGFARQSDGFVRLESAPGWGTKVQLCLPRHGEAAAVEEPVQALPSENAGAGRTVLLVDDEEAVREPVAQRLRDLGYNVLEAANGPDTLRLLDGEAHLDLLVTDVGLPAGMDGRQVAEVVRARRPGTPVLFVTGHTDTALPPEIQVIEKPFRLNALAQRIEMILREGARG